MTDPYRELAYPLNVFVHVLAAEEGEVSSIHYGLFDRPDEPIGAAQERSTTLLIERLPPPPARVLEVGTGLGTTLARILGLGYDAEGITPDLAQAALARAAVGDASRVHISSLETFQTPARYGALVFQESSQYIESRTLFTCVRALSASEATVIVLDEFSTRPLDRVGGISPLRRLDRFREAAEEAGFSLVEEVDLSRQAAPTVDYFLERLPRRRNEIVTSLGVSPEAIDELVKSGLVYRGLYLSGDYVYRLLRFTG